WPNPRLQQLDAIEGAACAQIERAAVLAAPGEVVHRSRGGDRAQVASLSIENPYAAGRGEIQVAAHVRLHAVHRFLPRYLVCEVDKNDAVSEPPVATHGISSDRLRLRIPVADIPVLLVV